MTEEKAYASHANLGQRMGTGFGVDVLVLSLDHSFLLLLVPLSKSIECEFLVADMVFCLSWDSQHLEQCLAQRKHFINIS